MAVDPARKAAERVTRARTMAADAAAAEVSTTFRARGIRSLLLKGPAVQRLAYGADDRDYVDADVLVPPHQVGLAESILRDLGFTPAEDEVVFRRGLLHSRHWWRHRDVASVDLHRTLFGVGVGPETTWREITRQTATLSVVGVEVEVLAPEAQALVVAIHAAQHESQRTSKAMEDLRRSVAAVGIDTWRRAAHLAKRLDAAPTMAMGLALVPEGAELAERLQLVDPALARTATEPGSRARLAVGFDELARAQGLLAKARLLAREIVPSRDFIYAWSPLARRGPVGMILVFLWRPLWLLAVAGPSYLAWRRHRRGVGR